MAALTAGPSWADEPARDPAPWSHYFGGNAGPTTFTPTMFGDLLSAGIGGGLIGFQGLRVDVPVFRGGFKIAENESPQPQDRVFLNYNYYRDVGSVEDVHRETIGLEKALLSGRASVGLRLPFFQVRGNGAGHDTNVGDLSVVLKYAVIDEPASGSTLSTGLVITAPTGPEAYSFVVRDGRIDEIHPWLLQPFVGYLWKRGDLFVHGFTSVAVPTDSNDVTIAFVDVGLGYWLFRGGGVLSAIVPTVEAHVNVPLDHRDTDHVPRFRNSVDLTAGFHFVFRDRLSVGLAVGVPVTSPRLFDVEAIANLNYRF